MFSSVSSDHISEALVRAGQHWEERRAARRAGRLVHSLEPTIAINRQAGARGSTIAQIVGQRLGWPVYDHELLQQIASQMQVRVSLLETVDERIMPWLEERIETFLSGPTVNDASYFRHLVQTILSLGEHGQAVIVGRGASFMLSSRTTLRVRLVAELEDRIAAMIGQRGLSLDQATRYVRDTDRERARFVKEHFHVDVADPLHYDLVLNASRLSTSGCAAIIVAALGDLRERLAAMPRAAMAAT
jgi:cytidylate kinase